MTTFEIADIDGKNKRRVTLAAARQWENAIGTMQSPPAWFDTITPQIQTDPPTYAVVFWVANGDQLVCNGISEWIVQTRVAKWPRGLFVMPAGTLSATWQTVGGQLENCTFRTPNGF